MKFREQSICTGMPEFGPFEDSTGNVGFSLFVAPSPYEREVLLYRDELQAMIDEIDTAHPTVPTKGE